MCNASLQEDERSPSPVHCLCRVSEMLRLILSFPSPLRCSQQLKHSQLPRSMEYLWIPLITEAETIPASVVWHAVGLASYRGAELAPRRLFHHLGADQQSAQFRQQSLARALGMEMLTPEPAPPLGWEMQRKWPGLCLHSFDLKSREIAAHGLVNHLPFSHHCHLVLALHMAFASPSKTNTSPKQPAKRNKQWYFSSLFFCIFPFHSLW